MDAKGALTKLAFGSMLAATLWVGALAVPAAAQQYGDWQSAAGTAAPQAAPAGEDAMQPVYQGTQQVVSFFGRELESAIGQTLALTQNLARTKQSGPGANYALSWSARERYPVIITGINQTVGFTKEELQFLTKRGSWITVREAGRERVVLTAVHSPGSNSVVSVAVPLAKFTGGIDPFRIGRDGRLFVIDAAGNVLNNPGRRLNVDREALLKMLGDDLGTLETRSSIISFSKIPSADWFMLIEVPKADARDGLVFPSDQQLRMTLPLEPPSEMVRVYDWGQIAVPALAAGVLVALGVVGGPWLLKRRRRAKKNKVKPETGLGNQPAFSLDDLDKDSDRLLNTEHDKLGKASKGWASQPIDLPEVKGDLASATRMKMALRQQSRDLERMLQQLQHSMELTISETRDQIHEVLTAHQGKIKALSGALEQTRSNLLFKADGEALAALVDDLKTKLFQAEADSRNAGANVEKRLSNLSRKVTDIETTMGKAVGELQDKLSDDLLGRQEAITRTMEALENKTREAQRQVTHDAAAAKLSAAQAAEQAATLEAEFQEMRTRFAMEIEDARKAAASDISAIRTQLAQLEELRGDLKDYVARFKASTLEWEENARHMSRKVNEEMAAMQQRIFDKEGDVEKLRILVDSALGHVNKAAEDFETKRERLERDLDTLKGRLFLGEEELEKYKAEQARRLDEVQVELDRRFAAHVAETERRTSEVVAEALASAMAAVARVDAARANGEGSLKAELLSCREAAEEVGARAERARARLEDKLLDEQRALEDRLLAQQRQALDRLTDLHAELTTQNDNVRNDLLAGRERDDQRMAEFEERFSRLEVRELQERTKLEDQLRTDFQALHQDLAGRHLALREEMVAAQEVYQADMREEWLAGRQEDATRESQARDASLEAIRQTVAALGEELRAQTDQQKQSINADLDRYQQVHAQHQAHVEQALGEVIRRVGLDLAAAKDNDDSFASRLVSVESAMETLHGQLMQEAATAQEVLRRLDSRLTELTGVTASRLEDLAQKSEQLVASAITALPDHPELVGLHRDIEQLSQDAYRGREDLETLRDLIERNLRELGEQHSEQYTKLTNLVQILLKLYQGARETDEKVSKVLSSQQHKVEGLHQEMLAIRSMVITKPGQGATSHVGGAPTPLL